MFRGEIGCCSLKGYLYGVKCCLPPCCSHNLEQSSLLPEIYRSAAWTISVVFAGFCAWLSAEMLGAISIYMSSVVTNFLHSSTDSHSLKHMIPTFGVL